MAILEEYGDIWGGVGGHGLWSAIAVSFLPSKKLELSLAGEPGCGSSASGGGTGRLLLFLDDVLAAGFRLRNMVVKSRTKNCGEIGVSWWRSRHWADFVL